MDASEKKQAHALLAPISVAPRRSYPRRRRIHTFGRSAVQLSESVTMASIDGEGGGGGAGGGLLGWLPDNNVSSSFSIIFIPARCLPFAERADADPGGPRALRIDSGVPARVREGQRAAVPHRRQRPLRRGGAAGGRRRVPPPPPPRRRRGDRPRQNRVEAQTSPLPRRDRRLTPGRRR